MQRKTRLTGDKNPKCIGTICTPLCIKFARSIRTITVQALLVPVSSPVQIQRHSSPFQSSFLHLYFLMEEYRLVYFDARALGKGKLQNPPNIQKRFLICPYSQRWADPLDVSVRRSSIRRWKDPLGLPGLVCRKKKGCVTSTVKCCILNAVYA
jgi:hypothetical protein